MISVEFLQMNENQKLFHSHAWDPKRTPHYNPPSRVDKQIIPALALFPVKHTTDPLWVAPVAYATPKRRLSYWQIE